MPLLEIWGGPHGPPPGFRPAFPDIRRKPGESAKTTQERRLSSRSSKERGTPRRFLSPSPSKTVPAAGIAAILNIPA